MSGENGRQKFWKLRDQTPASEAEYRREQQRLAEELFERLEAAEGLEAANSNGERAEAPANGHANGHKHEHAQQPGGGGAPRSGSPRVLHPPTSQDTGRPRDAGKTAHNRSSAISPGLPQSGAPRPPEPLLAKKQFRVFTTAQLNSEQFETRDLIPGILAAGQPGGIFGAFKTLKTSLAADLMVSLASGTPFLGRFPVPKPGRVLFLSGESGLPALRSIAKRICAQRGLSLDSLDNFRLSPDLPRFDRPGDVDALKKLVEVEKPVCVVIDPAYLALGGGNARNLFAMGQLLRPLAELCESTGCAVLLVHHCKRSSRVGEPATLDDIAGSGFAEFSAQWLLLARRRPFDAGTGQHELWLTAGSRAGHHGLWEVDVDEGTADQPEGRIWKTATRPVASAEARVDERFAAASEDRRLRRRAEAFSQQRQRVWEVLAAYPAGCNATTIREAVGINGERMKRILQVLVDEGAVSKTEEQIDRRRMKVTYQRIPPVMDLSAAAVEARRAGPPDQKVYNLRSGHFVEREKIRATVLMCGAQQEAEASKTQGLPPGGAPLPLSVGKDLGLGNDLGSGKDLGANRSDSTPATRPSAPAFPSKSGPDTGPDTLCNGNRSESNPSLLAPPAQAPRQAAPQPNPARTAPGAGATPLLMGVHYLRDGRIERVPPPKFR